MEGILKTIEIVAIVCNLHPQSELRRTYKNVGSSPYTNIPPRPILSLACENSVKSKDPPDIREAPRS